VLRGLAFLAAEDPTAKVSFTCVTKTTTITTPDNPRCVDNCAAQGRDACEAMWRDPAMKQLGYPKGMDGVVAFVQQIRREQRTDWAYAAYFTKYTVCHFGYANIGGPRLVIQWLNGSWGPDNIDRVFAHETGHIFYALDEYGDNCKCAQPSGYWKGTNGNCKNCPTPQLPCLMNRNTLKLCFYSRRQLGWGGFGPQMDVTAMNQARTSAAPALAESGGAVYMAFKKDGNNDLYACKFDGVGWGPLTDITAQNKAKTSFGPSLAHYGKLYLAFRGEGSGTIYACSFDGSRWSEQMDVTKMNSAKTSNTPAICAYGNRLYMVFKGDGGSTMYLCSFDGSRWSAQINVSDKNNAKTSGAPALAVYQDKLWVAFVGEDKKSLYAFSFNGSTFSAVTGITSINGALSTGGPALAANNGFLYLLFRGTDTTRMYACAFDGKTWLAQWNATDQNGAETSAPPALAPLTSAKILVAANRAKDSAKIVAFPVYPNAPAPRAFAEAETGEPQIAATADT
jgi:hypothetical protein